MSNVDWEKLKQEADRGMHGLGGVVEAIHRLDDSSGELGRRMLWLTRATVGLTVVQVVLAVAAVVVAYP